MSDLDDILKNREILINYFHERSKNAKKDIDKKMNELSEIDFNIVSEDQEINRLKCELSASINDEELKKTIQEKEALLARYKIYREKLLQEIYKLLDHCPDYFLKKK